ncbi:MAG: efflux RND transporter periplasmic adaptor subunit [Phycisphaerae bacterium]
MAASEKRKKFKFTGIKAMVIVVLIFAAVISGVWYLHRGTGEILPGRQLPTPQPQIPGHWVVVRFLSIRRSLRAVGTVTPINPVNLAARISGRVVQSGLYDGEKVSKGETLVRLDDTRLRAQLAAAVAMVQLAKAHLHQALIDQRRDRKLLATGDVTRQAMDIADTTVATDKASLANAVASQHIAAVILSHTRIVSPINGIVTEKMVSVGDTVMPGEVLAQLYDPAQLELDATVRESLAARLRLGEKLPLQLSGFAGSLTGRVRQIVPRVSTQTRSFILKISAHFPQGAWPGVFGHVLLPLRMHRMLVVPQAAVEYVGQLSVVDVALGKRRRMQAVQTGRRIGAFREILAGLTAGQHVWVSSAAPKATKKQLR